MQWEALLLDMRRLEPVFHQARRERARAAIAVDQRSSQLIDVRLHHVTNTLLA